MLVLPASAEVITGLVAAAEAAPEELSMIANVVKAPPMPFIPAERHGKPVVLALMVYAGDVEAGDAGARADPRAGDAARRHGPPDPLPGDLRGAGGPAAAVRRRATNMLVDALAPGAAEAILEHLETSTAQMAAVQLRVLGGAMARVARRRDRVRAPRREDDGQRRRGVRGPGRGARSTRPGSRSLATALSDGTAAAYVGFLGDDGDQGVRRAYPPATLERLAQVKRHYDPDNLFRLNLNVPPAVDVTDEDRTSAAADRVRNAGAERARDPSCVMQSCESSMR